MKAYFRKKTSRRTVYFGSVFLFFAVYAFSFATEDRHEIHVQNENHPPACDQKVLQDILSRYEELLWLGTKKTGSKASLIPSEMVFTKVSPAFDRAFFGLKTIALFVDGKYEDYLEFTSGQPKEKKLQWSEFQELQAHVKTQIVSTRGLSKNEIIQLLEFAVILDELQESQTLQSKAWIYEISKDDTTTLLAKMIRQHPEIFPTFGKLSKSQQTLLNDLFSLPSLEPVLTLTAPNTTFEALKKGGLPKRDPSLIELFLFYSECLTAKEHGDINFHFSNSFDSYTYKNFLLLRKAIGQLEEHSFDFASQYYITRRGDFLDLDASSPLHRVLIQMAAKRNLYTPAEGRALKENLLKLPVEELSRMINASSELGKKASHQDS